MLYNVGLYDWENIISKRYSTYDIFCYYIGGKFKIGHPFNSPLRKDDNPSFGIFPDLNGELIFKDFATGSVGGWVKFIQMKYGLTYRGAIIRAFVDLILSGITISDITINPNIRYTNNKSSIGIKITSYRDIDLKYWKDYNITEELLNEYDVIPITTVWVNGNIVNNRNKNDLMFAYLINSRIKVYSPLADKKNKWVGNSDSSCIFGYKQLPQQGDLLIITKALKDVMTLRSLGYYSIAGNSETTLLKENIIKELKSRFKTIIVLLDNDEPGIIAAEKYKGKYDLNYLLIESHYRCKDISDLTKKFGVEFTRNWLQQKIEVWESPLRC